MGSAGSRRGPVFSADLVTIVLDTCCICKTKGRSLEAGKQALGMAPEVHRASWHDLCVTLCAEMHSFSQQEAKWRLLHLLTNGLE